MSTPMAMAKAAGRTPRRNSTVHQKKARGRSARWRTPKNFHSWRARSRATILPPFVSRQPAGNVSQDPRNPKLRKARTLESLRKFRASSQPGLFDCHLTTEPKEVNDMTRRFKMALAGFALTG